MLGGAHDAVVGGVDVQRTIVFDIARHAGALEQVDVFAGIGDARHVVQVLGGGIAVLAAGGIYYHYRRTGGGKMHAFAADPQVIGRVLAVQYQLAGTGVHGFLYHVTGHAQAAVVPKFRPVGGTGIDAVGSGLVETHLLEDAKAVFHHGCHIGIAEWSVLAGAFTGMNGFQFLGQWRRTYRNAGFSASGSSRHAVAS